MSVVIPAFNEEKSLPACLQAIATQNHEGYTLELLVVDNNSTDNTSEVAKKYGARVVKETKQGYVFALNAGLMGASGDVIMVTDADTQVQKGWMIAGLMAFSDPQVVGVTGPVYPRAKNFRKTNFFGELYTLFLLGNFSIGKPHFTGSNFAVKREALHKINGLDLAYRMSPDVNLSLRLKKLGRIVFSSKMKVIASSRRWQSNPGRAFTEYAKGYFDTVWLHKPPKFQQKSLT